MTRERIIKCIHEGIRAGKERYQNETTKRWIAEPGHESDLVHGIYGKLNRRCSRNERASREHRFGDIRVDIALLNNQENPLCVIEVKREWNWQLCYEDLEKIYSLVKTYRPSRGGSLERGFLAVFLKQKSEGEGMDMDDRIHNITRHVEQDYRGRVLNFGFKRCDISRERFESSRWQTASLLIEIYA